MGYSPAGSPPNPLSDPLDRLQDLESKVESLGECLYSIAKFFGFKFKE